MRAMKWLLSLAMLGVAGCEAKVTSRVDEALAARVDTFRDCFPHLYPRVEALLAVANTWRLGEGAPTSEPAGLSAVASSEAGGTVVDIVYTLGGVTLTMAMRFYSPTGVQQTIVSLPTNGTLDAIVDAAATQLRASFPDGDSFVVGDWAISGGGVVATGEALTGIIGGTATARELEELRTTATSASVAGGPPMLQSSTIIDVGPPTCALTFATSGLRNDVTPQQQYPIGTVELLVSGPDGSVGAQLTFDGTTTLRAAVDGVQGAFLFDVVSRSLTYQR